MTSYLTPGELEVMKILWENEPLKPADIMARMPRAVSNAALRSMLCVLMEKGHVRRKMVGKAYYYRPTRKYTSAFREMTRRLADAFCGGSSFALIRQLVETEKLTEEQLEELRRIADSQSDGQQGRDSKR
jgi:predicted transcriptional regulator